MRSILAFVIAICTLICANKNATADILTKCTFKNPQSPPTVVKTEPQTYNVRIAFKKTTNEVGSCPELVEFTIGGDELAAATVRILSHPEASLSVLQQWDSVTRIHGNRDVILSSPVSTYPSTGSNICAFGESVGLYFISDRLSEPAATYRTRIGTYVTCSGGAGHHHDYNDAIKHNVAINAFNSNKFVVILDASESSSPLLHVRILP